MNSSQSAQGARNRDGGLRPRTCLLMLRVCERRRRSQRHTSGQERSRDSRETFELSPADDSGARREPSLRRSDRITRGRAYWVGKSSSSGAERRCGLCECYFATYATSRRTPRGRVACGAAWHTIFVVRKRDARGECRRNRRISATESKTAANSKSQKPKTAYGRNS